MSTSKIRANRRRLANKLRQLQGTFEQSVNTSMATIPSHTVSTVNVFKLFQGNRQKTKLQKNSKWIWYNRFYTSRREFNRSYGCNSVGNPLKQKDLVKVKVVKHIKTGVTTRKLIDSYTHEQIAMYYYKKFYN